MTITIARVIPISRGIAKETLSYFTLKKVGKGSLVSVPLRSREVLAVVVHVENAGDAKSQIRSASYGMKKISKVYTKLLFLPEFLDATERAARFYAASTGAVLNSLTPRFIREEYLKIASSPSQKAKKESTLKKQLQPISYEKLLLQTDEEERFSLYKSMIREEFARGNSVFFCLPTTHNLENTLEKLGRGIEEFTYILHAGLPKDQMRTRWKEAIKNPHPILIIGTPSFLLMPRNDFKMLIVEREHSPAYKKDERPYLDMRTFAEFLIEKKGGKLIFGDQLLRTETLFRKEKGEFVELRPLKFRFLHESAQKIINVKEGGSEQKTNKKFYTISKELKEMIAHVTEDNGSVFCFTARRGLYPLTTCSDCGEVVSCSECKKPMVLHSKKRGGAREANVFACHICGKTIESLDSCQECGSWRLQTLGIGAERVEEELKEYFPEKTILRLDKDTASTPKRAEKIRDAFYDTPGAILVGTERALPFLQKNVALISIVSLDSLFSLPDFRIQERIIALLLSLREKSRKHFIIQTRLENPLFQYAIRGNLIDFFRDEIVLRENFNYPPFSVLIKITVIGTKDKITKESLDIKEKLSAYDVTQYPAFTSKIRGKYVLHTLLKVPYKEWPNDELLRILYSFPPSHTIHVEPEVIL